MKICFCIGCGMRYFVFPLDDSSTSIRCLRCGKQFKVGEVEVVDEFDSDGNPTLNRFGNQGGLTDVYKIIVIPKDDCIFCHGTGITYQSVPYGPTSADFPVDCDCILDQIPEGYEGEIEIDYNNQPELSGNEQVYEDYGDLYHDEEVIDAPPFYFFEDDPPEEFWDYNPTDYM